MKNRIRETLQACSEKFYLGEYGEVRVTQEDELGKWLHELVRELHDDQLPNNWVFLTARRIFDEFVESSSRFDDYASEAETIQALEESIPELADSFVSAYNGERWEWFKAHGTAYDNQIIEVIQDGVTSLATAIGLAQAKVVEEMATRILHAAENAKALQVY